MCGRFTLTKAERAQVEDEMGITRGSLSPGYQPRFNIAPTDEHFIVRQKLEDREVVAAKWGLINHWTPAGSRPAGQINARAEGIDKRPAFRDAFLHRRCLVPADGFFEWTGPKEHRQPWWFHSADGRLFWFAGLYESWSPREGVRERTFTIITTKPNELVRPVHDRMPVILSDEDADTWLDQGEPVPSKLKALLRPAPEDLLMIRAVNPLLNSPKHDEAGLLEPYPASGAPGFALDA